MASPAVSGEGNGDRKSILCKYYMNGACVRGHDCPFSHEFSNLPNTVCTHWLKGYCAFGDKCRYDHVHPDWAPKRKDETNKGYEIPAVPKPHVDNLADMLPISKLRLSGSMNPRYQNGSRESSMYQARESACPIELLPADPFGSGIEQNSAAGWKSEAEDTCVVHHDNNGNYNRDATNGGVKHLESKDIDVAGSYVAEDTTYWLGDSSMSPCPRDETGQIDSNDPWSMRKDGIVGWGESTEEYASFGVGTSSLCHEYFRSGHCSSETCKFAHGTFCEICENYALHPSDSTAAEQHLIECRARHTRLQARARSSSVECCICYEKVLDKVGGERKFGLLSCDHAFCLGCIRNWRNSTSGGVDIDAALRTCPVCRTTTHFITPSSVWPQTAEEKEEIITGYKAKLASIDCRYFNFGEGTCPFGSSCMYKHAYPDGRLEDSAPRRVAVDEGEIKYVQPVRLSDFLIINDGRVRGRRR